MIPFIRYKGVKGIFQLFLFRFLHCLHSKVKYSLIKLAQENQPEKN